MATRGNSMDSEVWVAVIDDDLGFSESLVRLIESEGYRVIPFSSAADFLAYDRSEHIECAIVDLRMPGLSGIELQQRISEMLPDVSVVFLTGHGEIQHSVHAMKAGAVDFLEKPVTDAALFSAIRQAMERSQAKKMARDQFGSLRAKIHLLTQREREVFALVAAGLLNKQIAFKLGTSERTVKAHRRQVMNKLHAESLADLVRIADRLGIELISQRERDELSGRTFAEDQCAPLPREQDPPARLGPKSFSRNDHL
jgi:FixJ family two-component response regulator